MTPDKYRVTAASLLTDRHGSDAGRIQVQFVPDGEKISQHPGEMNLAFVKVYDADETHPLVGSLVTVDVTVVPD